MTGSQNPVKHEELNLGEERCSNLNQITSEFQESLSYLELFQNNSPET